MKLSKFLKGADEASYMMYVNQGNDHLCTGSHGFVIPSEGSIYIRDLIVADLEGSVDEPEGSSQTAHFKIGDVQLDITVRR